jgi:hypothetical protein
MSQLYLPLTLQPATAVYKPCVESGLEGRKAPSLGMTAS